MAALKRENVRFNRSIRLSNGRVIPIRKRNEPAATVYFGVRFKDGVTVFMPRAKGVEKRDLAELRAHALRVRGLPEKDSEIAVVTEACVKCARSIPGCGGCDHAAALKAEAEKKDAPVAEAGSKMSVELDLPARAKDTTTANAEGPGFSDGGKPVKEKS